MKKNFKMMVVSFAIWFGLTAGTSNAENFDLEFNDSGAPFVSFFGNDNITTSFTDHFLFTATDLMSGPGGSSIISGFDLGGFTVLFDQFELNDATDETQVGAGVLEPFGGTMGFTTALVAGHNYDLVVGGSPAPPVQLASYSGNLTISPVPEVETYVMLLAGLSLVGFAARRRKNSH